MSEEVIYKLHRYPSGELEEFEYVQELVRCKECKHRINDDDFQEKHICLLRRANGGKFCKDDDFCSYGQKERASDDRRKTENR